MLKYIRVISWIIIIVFAFMVGTWIAGRVEERIVTRIKEELIYDERIK